MPLQPRADDGIRTRDPHLGKVMRYQLRYIRKPRAIVSLAAMVDNSAPKATATNPLALTACSAQTPSVLVFLLGVVARRCCHPGPVAQWKSVRFTRGRSLVRSQPGPPSQGPRGSSSATAAGRRQDRLGIAFGEAGEIWPASAGARVSRGAGLALSFRLGKLVSSQQNAESRRSTPSYL